MAFMINDRKVDYIISKFLKFGTIFSGLIIVVGWILSFDQNNDLINLQDYKKTNLLLTLELEVMAGNWPIILCYAGLFSLICLPVLRVFISMLLLLKQKEKGMALISALVLIGLIISFTFGIEI
jgi:uncharacterized membrane protein